MSTNPYYNPSGTPGSFSPGASSVMRGEFAAVAAGFAAVATALTGLLASPGPIGNVTPGTGLFTFLVVNTSLTTANLVVAGNQSVTNSVTIGNALTVTGSTRIGAFGANGASASTKITIAGSRGSATAAVLESLLQAMQTFGFVFDSTTP